MASDKERRRYSGALGRAGLHADFLKDASLMWTYLGLIGIFSVVGLAAFFDLKGIWAKYRETKSGGLLPMIAGDALALFLCALAVVISIVRMFEM